MLEALILLPLAFSIYAYVAYPVLLVIAAACHRTSHRVADFDWPPITVTIPCHNAARYIAGALDTLLLLDYPSDRRHILVISDASTDATDAIVRGFAGRGVELVRLDRRVGKTVAENVAGGMARGDIVVNMDSTTRAAPRSLKALVLAFADPTVGVASGRDVSVASFSDDGTDNTIIESWYVDYEMFVRQLETHVASIVGASGCFYATRRSLYDTALSAPLSRDFGAVLHAREQGFRSVSVMEALCFVPRTISLKSELRRKSRTMAGGLLTLWYARHLLNPFKHGVFAWMLFSHKLCRWLVYCSLPLAATALMIASTNNGTWRPYFLLA
ncbi:MAG TPA: glycosyltransferase, partial [Gemmatimonadaceae bacterium]|nr:glycosyltransferase [Gemmatimonadaceae bacterium]